MARKKRSSGRRGGGDLGSVLKDLIVGLAGVGITLAVLTFVVFSLEERSVAQYIALNDLDNETYCDTQTGSPCESIRDEYENTRDVITLGSGILGIVIIVVVFMRFLMPMVS